MGGVQAPSERLPQYLLYASGGGFLYIGVEVLVLASIESPHLFENTYLGGLLTSLPFLLVAGYCAHWLRTTEVSPERYPRIVRWIVGAAGASIGINAVLMVLFLTNQFGQLLAWARWAIIVGGTIGLLMGSFEARAIERAVTAERTVVRQEQLERQRELLEYLNAVLRHEVLNTASVISGYALRIQETTSTESDQNEWAAIIEEEAQETSRVVEDVRVLVKTITGEHQLTSVDLSAVVRDEVGTVSERNEDVRIRTDLPATALVRADEQLHRVVRCLVSNAVGHNDDPSPVVEVTVEITDTAVRLDVVDNGPGVPEAERPTLFERTESTGGAHEMGLYLAAQLVDRYDGSIDLAETGPDGSRFTVELPAVDSDPDAIEADESRQPVATDGA